jgi:hypothetical protein
VYALRQVQAIVLQSVDYFLRLRDANGKTYGKISILKMK